MQDTRVQLIPKQHLCNPGSFAFSGPIKKISTSKKLHPPICTTSYQFYIDDSRIHTNSLTFVFGPALARCEPLQEWELHQNSSCGTVSDSQAGGTEPTNTIQYHNAIPKDTIQHQSGCDPTNTMQGVIQRAFSK